MVEYKGLGHSIRDILENRRKGIHSSERPDDKSRLDVPNTARPDEVRTGPEASETPTRQQEIQKKIIDESEPRPKKDYRVYVKLDHYKTKILHTRAESPELAHARAKQFYDQKGYKHVKPYAVDQLEENLDEETKVTRKDHYSSEHKAYDVHHGDKHLGVIYSYWDTTRPKSRGSVRRISDGVKRKRWMAHPKNEEGQSHKRSESRFRSRDEALSWLKRQHGIDEQIIETKLGSDPKPDKVKAPKKLEIDDVGSQPPTQVEINPDIDQPPQRPEKVAKEVNGEMQNEGTTDKFITDMGKSHDAINQADGSKLHLARYGVWAHDKARGKHQVIETGDDLDALKKKHGVADHMVHKLKEERLDEISKDKLSKYFDKSIESHTKLVQKTRDANAVGEYDGPAERALRNRRKGQLNAWRRYTEHKFGKGSGKKYTFKEEALEEDMARIQMQNRSGKWITVRETNADPSNLLLQMRNLQKTFTTERLRAIGSKGQLMDLGPVDLPRGNRNAVPPIEVVETHTTDQLVSAARAHREAEIGMMVKGIAERDWAKARKLLRRSAEHGRAAKIAADLEVKREDVNESYREYKMTYERRSKEKGVERLHTHLDLGGENYKYPEAVDHAIKSHPKHKELRKQGWNIHQFGQHDGRTESWGQKVNFVKEETEDDYSVVLHRSDTDRVTWKHKDKRSAWRRAASLSDLHSVNPREEGNTIHVDAKNWYRKKNVKEETLDELSKATKESYAKKAADDMVKHDKSGNDKKADKRFSGIKKALKEETEMDEKKFVLPTEYGGEYSVRKLYEEKEPDWSLYKDEKKAREAHAAGLKAGRHGRRNTMDMDNPYHDKHDLHAPWQVGFNTGNEKRIKETGKKTFQEEEQLDEISKGLAMRYADKVSQQMKSDEKEAKKFDKAKDQNDYDKMGGTKKHMFHVDRLVKRQNRGVDILRNKLTGKAKVPLSGGKHRMADYVAGEVKKMEDKRDAKIRKEETQLDELSKGTLGSYIKKATPNLMGHTIDAVGLKDKRGAKDAGRKMGKRIVGIQRAADRLDGTKLTKEEMLDEISKEKVEKYREASKKDLKRTQGRIQRIVKKSHEGFPDSHIGKVSPDEDKKYEKDVAREGRRSAGIRMAHKKLGLKPYKGWS